MTASRIPPVTSPDEEQSALLDNTLLAPDGSPFNVFATLAHRPRLLRRVNALGGYFFVHAEIAERDRELVILRTAARIDCPYEIAQHRSLAAQAGLTSDEIGAALDLESWYRWSPEDSALLGFVDELLRTDTVGDETWDRLADRYDALQRTELLVLVGYYRMLGGVLNGLRVQIDAPVLPPHVD